MRSTAGAGLGGRGMRGARGGCLARPKGGATAAANFAAAIIKMTPPAARGAADGPRAGSNFAPRTWVGGDGR